MKKTILSVLISAMAIIMLAFSVSAAELHGQTLYTKGDLDNDGKITVSDARTCLRAAVGLDELTPIQRMLALFGESDKVGVGDARSILRIAVGLDMKLPEGHVHHYQDGLGTDPTCTAYGYGEYWCDGCEYQFYTFTEPVGHSFDENGVCENCGEGLAVKVLDGKGTIQLAVNETAVVRVAFNSDKARNYIAKANVDIVGLACSEETYYNETDGEYAYIFITLLKDPVDYVVVNIWFEDMPNIKDSVGIEIVHSGTGSKNITTDICTVPDIGTVIGLSPSRCYVLESEGGSVDRSFMLAYRLDGTKTYEESLSAIEKVLKASGFALIDNRTVTSFDETVRMDLFENASTNTYAMIQHSVDESNNVLAVYYIFSLN